MAKACFDALDYSMVVFKISERSKGIAIIRLWKSPFCAAVKTQQADWVMVKLLRLHRYEKLGIKSNVRGRPNLTPEEIKDIQR